MSRSALTVERLSTHVGWMNWWWIFGGFAVMVLVCLLLAWIVNR